ncbi:MAG: hypothetical protein P8Y50_06685 [Sulfurovaceae bacterium]
MLLVSSYAPIRIVQCDDKDRDANEGCEYSDWHFKAKEDSCHAIDTQEKERADP